MCPKRCNIHYLYLQVITSPFIAWCFVIQQHTAYTKKQSENKLGVRSLGGLWRVSAAAAEGPQMMQSLMNAPLQITQALDSDFGKFYLFPQQANGSTLIVQTLLRYSAVLPVGSIRTVARRSAVSPRAESKAWRRYDKTGQYARTGDGVQEPTKTTTSWPIICIFLPKPSGIASIRVVIMA